MKKHGKWIGVAALCLTAACGSSGGGTGNAAGATGNTAGAGGKAGGSTAGVGGSNDAGGNKAGGSGGAGTSTNAGTSCKASGAGRSDCNGESCCASVKVPGGTFFRAYTNDGSGAQDKDSPATISDVQLDKYIVTVGRYRQFVEAWRGGYRPAAGSGKHGHLNGGKGLVDSGKEGSYEPGWQSDDSGKVELTATTLTCDSAYSTWTDSPGKNENLPMNCLNWWEAYAFCIWDGGFLPSHAEFEYAAAGGDEHREFPWGSQSPADDSTLAICNCNYPKAKGTCNGVENIAPVGTAKKGAGRWGHLDLVGEVDQWNLDWFSPELVSPCVDCAHTASGSGRVVRDGYYSSTEWTLLVPYRNSLYPTNRFATFGVRCARSP
jgi:formylglycine-generating enzyme required for sulfatase activity